MTSYLLHACGDVSPAGNSASVIEGSAPRMWRCFYVWFLMEVVVFICSTHVEMFPPCGLRGRPFSHLLHACGDVSGLSLRLSGGSRSAPRMWRCFSPLDHQTKNQKICSTHVEMFPNSLGGTGMVYKSAPRMWRCFPPKKDRDRGGHICSTHVEMFPPHQAPAHPRPDLLHACGDVSKLVLRDINLIRSAPRMWRCFLGHLVVGKTEGICSTHVEMFPTGISS